MADSLRIPAAAAALKQQDGEGNRFAVQLHTASISASEKVGYYQGVVGFVQSRFRSSGRRAAPTPMQDALVQSDCGRLKIGFTMEGDVHDEDIAQIKKGLNGLYPTVSLGTTATKDLSLWVEIDMQRGMEEANRLQEERIRLAQLQQQPNYKPFAIRRYAVTLLFVLIGVLWIRFRLFQRATAFFYHLNGGSV